MGENIILGSSTPALLWLVQSVHSVLLPDVLAGPRARALSWSVRVWMSYCTLIVVYRLPWLPSVSRSLHGVLVVSHLVCYFRVCSNDCESCSCKCEWVFQGCWRVGSWTSSGLVPRDFTAVHLVYGCLRDQGHWELGCCHQLLQSGQLPQHSWSERFIVDVADHAFNTWSKVNIHDITTIFVARVYPFHLWLLQFLNGNAHL